MKNLMILGVLSSLLYSKDDAPAIGAEAEPNTDGAPGATDGTTVPAAETDGNPFDAIFERAVFSLSDTDREYPTQSGGSNKKLADVLVILKGGFASIPGSVYRRKTPNSPNVVEFTFLGSKTQSAIKPHDPASRAQLTEFRNRVTLAFIDWYKAQPKAKSTTGQQVSATVEFND